MKKVIAIDLGATNLRVALVDEQLTIIKCVREKSVHKDEDALYEQIKRMIEEILANVSDADSITSIGISAAGFVHENEIKFSPNLEIGKFDLCDRLEEDFPNMKAHMANDANCSALVEALYGAGKNYETPIFITISSGIGVGVVNHKHLINLPLECGHFYVNYKNTVGQTNIRFYELEQICSGNGIVNLCKINNFEVENAEEFFKLVLARDKQARKIYDDWLQIMGSFISNLQVTFNSDAIVLSGGVMKSKVVFYNDLLSVSNAFVAPFPVRKIKFVNAQFDQDTGIIGGAAIALNEED